MEQDLELLVGNLVEEEIIRKETQKANNKLASNMKKGICYGKDAFNYNLLTFKYDIAKIMTFSNGKDVLKKNISELKAKGENILNTNLPADILE